MLVVPSLGRATTTEFNGEVSSITCEKGKMAPRILYSPWNLNKTNMLNLLLGFIYTKTRHNAQGGYRIYVCRTFRVYVSILFRVAVVVIAVLIVAVVLLY